MAAIAAVVAAIARSSWRDLRTLNSIAGNNLLAVIALIMADEPPKSPSGASFFLFLGGCLLLFPLSADLLRHIPADRLKLWPLSAGQRTTIQIAMLALNPMLLIAIVCAAASRQPAVGAGLLIGSIVFPVVTFATNRLRTRAPGWKLIALVPRFPGRHGGIVQNQVRHLLGSLDVYFAAVLAIGGAIYCFFTPHPDPAARLGIGLMVVVTLSTLAQCQFGFDRRAEQDRYRLLPVSGLDVLLAKDAAWFGIAVLLTWPFHILPCLAAALTALSIGHHTAAHHPVDQTRWRFAAGRLFPTGVFQIGGLLSAGIAVENYGAIAALGFLAAYLVSLWWYSKY